MKVSTIFLAFAVAVSAAPLPASAEILQGLRFVTAMKDNTLFREDRGRDGVQRLFPARRHDDLFRCRGHA